MGASNGAPPLFGRGLRSETDPMTEVADKIITLLEKRTALSSKEIAEALFGQEKGYPQRVDGDLRNLVSQGRIERFGAGGSRHPHTYRIKSAADVAEPK